MSQEDSLRMVAEVVDKFSLPLRNLRSSLQAMSKDGASHSEVVAKGLSRVETAAKGAAQTATGVLNPALATVGVTGLGVAAALAGVQSAVRNFTTNASGLGQMSRDTGVTAQQLRDVQSILGKVGVDSGASAAGIQRFAESMRLARNGIGPLMEFLRTQGKTTEGRAYFNQLADDLMRSKDNGEALTKALKGMEGIEDPVGRRVYAEQVLGLAEAARLAEKHRGTIAEQLAKAGKEAGPLTPAMVKSAEDYDKALSGLASTMKKIGTAIAMELEGPLAKVAVSLKGFLDDERKGVTPGIVTTIRETVAYIESIDWAGAFKGVGPGFEQIKAELGAALTQVRDVLREFGTKDNADAVSVVFSEIGKAATSTATAIRAVALALGALNDAKNLDFGAVGKKLSEIDRITDVGVGKRSNAEPSKKLTVEQERLQAQLNGTSAADAPEAQRQAENLRANAPRVAQIEERLGALGRQIGNFESLPKGPANEAAEKRADEMRREMGKLTDELRRLRDAIPDKRPGEASVEKMSAVGASGIDPSMIHKASLGVGSSMARVGNMLAETQRQGLGITVPEGPLRSGRFSDPTLQAPEGPLRSGRFNDPTLRAPDGPLRSGEIEAPGLREFSDRMPPQMRGILRGLPGMDGGRGESGLPDILGRVLPQLQPFLRGGPPGGRGGMRPWGRYERDGGGGEARGLAGRGGPDARSVHERPDFGSRRRNGLDTVLPIRPRDGGPGEQVGRALRGEAPDTGAARPEANPSAYKDVLDHIAKSEGTAHKAGGGYNTSLGYGRYLPGGKEQNLTSMTLDEIGALGRHMRRQPGNPNSSALGRYQIVGDTMRRLQKRMDLSGNDLFDEKMQDRMAAELARDRGANPRGLQQEWASLVGEKNRRAVELMQRIPRGASTVPRDRPPREVADGEGWAARERARKQIDAPALPTFSAKVRELQEQADRNRLNFDSPGMSKALRAGVNGGPTINNDGRVEVHVARPGPDTKVSTSASGNLFRDVKLNRGATMAQASQEN